MTPPPKPTAGAVDLEARLERARAAWPGVDVPTEVLLAHLGEAPDDLLLEDLYLALGCGLGQPRALAHFRRLMDDDLRKAVQRPRRGLSTADEAFQVLCQHLFVAGEDGLARIARYSGRGRLRGWARVVLARMLADQAKSRLDEAEPFDDARLAEAVWMGDDPELAFIKAQTREQLRASVGEALAGLSARERNLLRQHYVHGLGIDALARLIGAHRATAARQLVNAREALCSGIRRQLSQRLGLGYAELQSLLALVSSRLDVSLPRLLVASSEP